MEYVEAGSFDATPADPAVASSALDSDSSTMIEHVEARSSAAQLTDHASQQPPTPSQEYELRYQVSCCQTCISSIPSLFWSAKPMTAYEPYHPFLLCIDQTTLSGSS
jgi:hypothetical protein